MQVACNQLWHCLELNHDCGPVHPQAPGSQFPAEIQPSRMGLLFPWLLDWDHLFGVDSDKQAVGGWRSGLLVWLNTSFKTSQTSTLLKKKKKTSLHLKALCLSTRQLLACLPLKDVSQSPASAQMDTLPGWCSLNVAPGTSEYFSSFLPSYCRFPPLFFIFSYKSPRVPHDSHFARFPGYFQIWGSDDSLGGWRRAC